MIIEDKKVREIYKMLMDNDFDLIKVRSLLNNEYTINEIKKIRDKKYKPEILKDLKDYVPPEKEIKIKDLMNEIKITDLVYKKRVRANRRDDIIINRMIVSFIDNSYDSDKVEKELSTDNNFKDMDIHKHISNLKYKYSYKALTDVVFKLDENKNIVLVKSEKEYIEWRNDIIKEYNNKYNSNIPIIEGDKDMPVEPSNEIPSELIVEPSNETPVKNKTIIELIKELPFDTIVSIVGDDLYPQEMIEKFLLYLGDKTISEIKEILKI